ncbi:hypothetical protein LJC23_04135 [Desulfovibrio sp. OttesenSCG-928-I05]|nr:hypothetical protein [Desulfovibrio sp. OttesenSCG-928-I05]
MNMNPFLMRFRQELPAASQDDEPMTYSEDEQASLLEDGSLAWRARYKRPPTNCHTAGRYIPSGYTRSGKWKSGRYSPSKTDKRAGK